MDVNEVTGGSGLKLLLPCNFKGVYIREFNYKTERFDWKNENLKFRRISKVKMKDGVLINNVALPGIFVLRVLLDGEEKSLTARDILKLAKEGRNVRTPTGDRITADNIDEFEICVYDFETEYPPHSIFVEGNGLYVRAQSPESLVGITVSQKLSELVSELLPGILELEFDKSILRHTQVTKKRYAGWKNEDKFLVKGLEIVRRDWGDKAKELQRKAIMLTLHKPPDIAKREITKMIEEEIERFNRGDFTIDEVILSSGIRDFSEYKRRSDGSLPNLPQLRVAVQLMSAGLIVPPGSKVEYVPFKVPAEDVLKFVRGELSIEKLMRRVPKKKKDVPPLYERVVARELIEDRFDELKPLVDVDYYLESQILPPILRFASAMWPDFKIPKKKRDRKTEDLTKFLKPRKKVGDVVI